MSISLKAEKAKEFLAKKRYIDEKLIPSDKYLEKCFLLFKRFLKENGSYNFIISHIFPCKRTKEDFFRESKRLYGFKYGNYDFGGILQMKGTLGDRYRHNTDFKNSNRYWEIHIRPISESWKAFFIAHQPEIDDEDFVIES